MARLHTHSKGKSGSKKPITKTSPSWLNYSAKEIEAIIAKLSKQGMTSAQIGLVMRDSYGVPDVRIATKKKITAILKEKGLTSNVPEDLANLQKREANAQKHFEANKKDMVTKRGLQLIRSKIRRLEKYYIKTGAYVRPVSAKRKRRGNK
jgi:small subunit ribosomal protein S15